MAHLLYSSCADLSSLTRLICGTAALLTLQHNASVTLCICIHLYHADAGRWASGVLCELLLEAEVLQGARHGRHPALLLMQQAQARGAALAAAVTWPEVHLP